MFYPFDISPIKRILARLKRGRVTDGDLLRLTDRQKWAYAWMPKSGIALHVGSSSNPICAALANKSVYAFVVDEDGMWLPKLSDGHASVQPIQASALKLPFPSGSIDTVLLLDVLERVGNEQAVIEEVQRVLRPGGKLILSVPNRGLFKFPNARRDRAVQQHRHYSQADLTRLLFLRFRVLQRHYGGLLFYPLSMVADNFMRERLRVDWSRFFQWLGDLDHDISWGRWSYNVIILAEKI
jgi:SAM-dependent methyltransferase